MSAQSGIGVGEALTAAWAETSAPESSVRLLKISIEQGEPSPCPPRPVPPLIDLSAESLVPSASKAPSRTAEEDFELLEDLLDPVTPSYFAYRLDPNEAGSTSWLFITYVPDEAKVRDKMVYASTRATLTRQASLRTPTRDGEADFLWRRSSVTRGSPTRCSRRTRRSSPPPATGPTSLPGRRWHL